MVKTSLIKSYLGGWTGTNMQDVGKRRKKAAKKEELENIKSSIAYKSLKQEAKAKKERKKIVAKAKKKIKKGASGKKSKEAIGRVIKKNLKSLKKSKSSTSRIKKELKRKRERTILKLKHPKFRGI